MSSIQRITSPLTGAVSYRAQVRVKGRPAQSETFPNRKEAQQWAQSIESAIRENRHFPHMRASKTLFVDLTERYRTNVLKGATRGAQLDWWKNRFIGLTLAEVTADKIAEARDALAAETFTRGKERTVRGKVIAPRQYTRSGGTVNRYLATLSHVFTIAVKEWRLVDRNPLRDISKKKEPRGRIRFLSDAERDALLAACAKSDWPALHTLVMLAISTGARRGELIRLKWADVDLKAAIATVRETKNGEPRVLPLVGKALAALRELKLQGSAQSPWVFQQPSGFPGPYEVFDAHWYAALEAAGINDCRFHDLRHTCASYLAQQGCSLLEIGNVLGHRTASMTMRYSHLTQTSKTAALRKMAEERGL